MMTPNELYGIFPNPIYITKRDLVPVEEEKEIENIIAQGMQLDGIYGAAQDQHTNNTYIFNTNLKNLKEFCEEHIRNYVEQIINPREKLDFYITQSWINVVEPGGKIKKHWHENSIISGTFYLSVEEDDKIMFNVPYQRYKSYMGIVEPKEFNIWNSGTWSFNTNHNMLILFPSWLEHGVEQNEKATTNRISLAFNTFVKGTIGRADALNELILS